MRQAGDAAGGMGGITAMPTKMPFAAIIQARAASWTRMATAFATTATAITKIASQEMDAARSIQMRMVTAFATIIRAAAREEAEEEAADSEAGVTDNKGKALCGVSKR